MRVGRILMSCRKKFASWSCGASLLGVAWLFFVLRVFEGCSRRERVDTRMQGEEGDEFISVRA